MTEHQIDYQRVCIKDLGKKKQELEQLNIDLEEITGFLARNNWDTPANRAVLQPWVWQAENEMYHEPLIEGTANDLKKLFQAMLGDGGVVFKAVCNQKIVGAIMVIKFPKKVSLLEVPEEEVERPRPIRPSDISDNAWWKMVQEWAISEIRDCSIQRSLQESINHYFDKYKGLWEISCLGVDKTYRRRGIGKELVHQALSEVTRGDTVLLLAEPEAENIYRRFGFSVSSEQEKYRYCVLPQRGKELHKFPVMTMKK
ncbi:hypothetical protein F4779DRAFT_576339 [Xylariaceae sp. FL0662B]|nr:hypothetical protein F4779DRAFT_576339 [Xylariaceae sp. FL0662B]